MAGVLIRDREIVNLTKHSVARIVGSIIKAAALCALLAGPFSLGAKAQVAQSQTVSSGTSQQPDQTQAQKPPAKDQSTEKTQEKKKKPAKAAPPPKPIKAHVKKLDDKKKNDVDTSQSVEPDKVLYERAMLDVKKGRYTEGRLSLQALINTYPDSEFLAKAKLAVADSYYKEGGTSNLTQAIDEYKNFIIFFPFLDEAAYAQMQIGMGHYRMMEKSDRDTTQVIEAEQEFQTFLLKYPQSPLVPKAEQYLRGTQEVLADGEFRVARFYYLKQDYPASAARLFEVTERYPLYSQSDEALWMLGDVYDRARHVSKNEDEKNHWADLAGKCYARIAQNYPLSHLGPQAKSRLTAMGMPVPAADPGAVARMQQQQLYEKEHRQNAALRLPLGVLHSGPDVQLAAHAGSPNLNPPDDAISARDVLKQGANGPDFDIRTKPVEENQATSNFESGPQVEPVPVSPNTAAAGSNIGVQIIGTGSESSAAPASSQTSPAATNPGTAPAPGVAPPANPPATTTSTDVTPASTGASATGTSTETAVPTAVQGGTASTVETPATNGTSPAPVTATSGQTPAQANGQTPAPANAQANGQKNAQTAAKSDSDSSKESSSKKKKGIKKVIPW